MLATLRNNRLGIKYTIITLILVGGVLALASMSIFEGAEQAVNSAMDKLAEYGAVGMFFIAAPSNMTLVIQVPYNLPMFTLIIYSDTLLEVIWIGVATGVGGGIGEVVSYAVAHAIVNRVQDLEDSALFRWTKKTIERRPGLIPYFIWLGSATPVPDLVIIVPVAMVKYPWQKMVIPMITGKIFQNVIIALLMRYATDSASRLASGDINFDLTTIIATVFITIIAYQIEKSRTQTNNHGNFRASEPEEATTE